MAAIKMDFELVNRLADLDRLNLKLDEFRMLAGIDTRCFGQISLALEELFTNIVQHGHADGCAHRIAMFLSLAGDMLVIRIEDDGVPFDPNKVAKPDLKCSLEQRRIGGLGIYLIKQVMDEVQYLRCDDKNVTILKKSVAGPLCRPNRTESKKQ